MRILILVLSFIIYPAFSDTNDWEYVDYDKVLVNQSDMDIGFPVDKKSFIKEKMKKNNGFKKKVFYKTERQKDLDLF